MKQFKKQLTLLLAIVLCVSLLVVPAAASQLNDSNTINDTYPPEGDTLVPQGEEDAEGEEEVPSLPTATVTSCAKDVIEDRDPLSFALTFAANIPEHPGADATEEQIAAYEAEYAAFEAQTAYYGDWFADFVLEINKDATFNAISDEADGYLAGQYDIWGSAWVAVPEGDVPLKANTPLKIMEYAAEVMTGEKGLKLTYNDVLSFVKVFNCGIYFTPEFLKANPDFEVTLALRIYNNEDESETYPIGEEYTFTAAQLLHASIDDEYYFSLEEAIADAEPGDTIKLLQNINASDTITIPAGADIKLDLNNHNITGTPTEAKVYEVIKNAGNLTITGNGTILCDHKLAGSTCYAVNTITNSGTLNINGGTIENKSTASNQIGYAIDNNSTSYNSVVVINGGTVKASGSAYYDGIRLYCNNVTAENSVSVKSGSVSTIWMQNPSDSSTDRNSKDMKGSVSISGGNVTALYLEPSGGFEASISGGNIGSVSYTDLTNEVTLRGFISGGIFTTKPDDTFIADGCTALKIGEVYNVHKHEVKAVPETPKDCSIPGTKAHYACADCGLKYTDATGTTLITDETTLLIPASHSTVLVSKKDATCTADGNTEHWKCNGCGQLFIDQAGNALLSKEEVTIKAAHTPVKVDAVAATCSKSGNKEHYKCACGSLFSDDEGTTAVTAEALATELLPHTLAPVEEVPASYTAAGTKAHYACSVCAEKFTDAEGKNKATELTIPQLIEVVGNKAEVSEGAVDVAIEAAGTTGDVKLDLTHDEVIGEENAPVSSAELPVAALEKVAEAEASLTLTKADAVVTLDTKALEAVAEQAEGSTVTLVVEEIKTEELTKTQQVAVEDKKVAAVISAELICTESQKPIGTEAAGGFGGGTITVKIPFTPEEGFKGTDYVVIYVADDGTTEEVATVYKDGFLIIELTHFSDYVVINTAAEEETKPTEPTNPTVPNTGDDGIVLPLVMMLICGTATICLIIKKKALF